MRVSLLSVTLVIGCASGPAPDDRANGADTTGADTTGADTTGAETPGVETATRPPTLLPPQAGSVECTAYLAHYQRCEAALASEIAMGDRRSYASEEGWVQLMEGSAEGPAMPAACRDMDAALTARCP